MKGISDLLKCPECHRKGTMDVIIRKKQIEAQCDVCHKLVTERVPYPKHRTDDEGYYLPFRVGEVRSFLSDDYDEYYNDKQ